MSAYDNTVEARAEGALNLQNSILLNITEGESTHLIGHSHGGNVIKEHSQLADPDSIDSVLLLGTPNRESHVFNFDSLSNEATFVNAYDNSDIVQRLGGIDSPSIKDVLSFNISLADRTIDHPSVENLEVEPTVRTNMWNLDADIVYPGGNDIYDGLVGDHINLDSVEVVNQVFEQSSLGYETMNDAVIPEQLIERSENESDDND